MSVKKMKTAEVKTAAENETKNEAEIFGSGAGTAHVGVARPEVKDGKKVRGTVAVQVARDVHAALRVYCAGTGEKMEQVATDAIYCALDNLMQGDNAQLRAFLHR